MALPDRIIQPMSSQSGYAKEKNTLASVAKMRELFRQEGMKAPQYSIDAKGTIIFKLPGGGSIRDAGGEVHYSHGNGLAKRLAIKLAQFRGGQSVLTDGDVLKSPLPPHHSRN